MTVLRRTMTLPVRASVVVQFAEAGMHNPLDSIYKLSNIVTRKQRWTSGALHHDQFCIPESHTSAHEPL